jgi:hypothetical protein
VSGLATRAQMTIPAFSANFRDKISKSLINLNFCNQCSTILDCLSNSCSDQVDILKKLAKAINTTVLTGDKSQLPVRQLQGQFDDLRNY